MHVRSLGDDIPGNEDYLGASHPLKGVQWAESFDIIRKHYPKECAEGIFKVDTTEPAQSVELFIENKKAVKAFGITFKSFEEQVLSSAGQYLEIIGRK